MEQEILRILKDKKNTSLTSIEINDYLNYTSVEDYENLQLVLNKLCQDGKIYYSEKKKRYTPIENTNFKTGRLIVNPKGYGFVAFETDVDDVYINGSNLLDARNNDIVLIEIINKSTKEGKVIRVLKRDDTSLVGEFYQEGNLCYVRPDKKEYGNIIIPEGKTKGAVPGHKVLIKQLDLGHEHVGEVIRIIGHKNDVGVDILSFVYQYEFDPTYNEDVMNEVASMPSEVLLTEVEGRVDLRHEMIFTMHIMKT